MNCSRNSVFDLPHLFCCLLRECPESISMSHHKVKHLVLRGKVELIQEVITTIWVW